MRTRKKYTKEFKMDAVSLVVEQDYSRLEASKRLEIDPKILTRWIKENESGECDAFRGKGKLTLEQVELRQLRSQVKRLEMEREILKKATVFFAKETK